MNSLLLALSCTNVQPKHEYDSDEEYDSSEDIFPPEDPETAFDATEMTPLFYYESVKTPTVDLPSHKISFPLPLQLASEKSGFCTLFEYQAYLQELAIQAETEKELADFSEEKKIRLIEEAKKKKEREFYDSLPTESKAFREKRLAAQKTKPKKENKPLPFGHRRNGGKSKNHSEVDPEVIKARRAERRKIVKAEKKEAERIRKEHFATQAEPKKIENIPVPIVHEDFRTAEILLVKKEQEFLPVKKESPKKEVKSEWTTVPMKKKLVIKMGAASYNKSENKISTDVSKSKTRMCKSVMENTPCPHGSACRFAHNVNELTPTTCSYGSNCKFQKKCFFLHPSETKDQYITRLYLPVPSNTEKPKTPPSTEHPPSTEKLATKSVWKPPELPVNKNPWKIETSTEQVTEDPWIFVENSKKQKPQEKFEKNNIEKYRMCTSVLNNTTCPHGSRCRFAHSVDELTPKECTYGVCCRFKDSERCAFIHPQETKDQYVTRLCIPVPKKPVEKSIKTTVAPQTEKEPPVYVPPTKNVWQVLRTQESTCVSKIIPQKEKEETLPMEHSEEIFSSDSEEWKKVEKKVHKSTMKKNTKTKVCTSFLKNDCCSHGENCWYAHSHSELGEIPSCKYGSYCTKSECYYLHPGETPEKFYNRLENLHKNNTPPPVVQPQYQAPHPVVQPQYQAPHPVVQPQYQATHPVVQPQYQATPGAGIILRNEVGEFLFVKEKSGKWGFPKGRREDYDLNSWENAKRKFLEEVVPDIYKEPCSSILDFLKITASSATAHPVTYYFLHWKSQYDCYLNSTYDLKYTSTEISDMQWIPENLINQVLPLLNAGAKHVLAKHVLAKHYQSCGV
tara:strand:- start:63 stop:2606 length:2544 start_codon:yes stop_codon:yes gene_type:complete